MLTVWPVIGTTARPAFGMWRRMNSEGSEYNAGLMRLESILVGVGLAAALTGCGSVDNREWMKVDQKYTTEEFRRDYGECSKGGTLDDECMKRRGWVAVAPGKEEKRPPDPLSQPAGRSGRR